MLAAFGDFYFEAFREIDDPRTPSAAAEYNDALSQNPVHAGALLGQFRLHRYNPYLYRRSAESYLTDLLNAQPDSIPGHLEGLRADLEDGKLVSARQRLERLEELAPGRRDVRTARAALHWIVHEREECEAVLAELLEADPADSVPEREVGRHLLELYRFAEGLPFLQRATERDAEDHRAWTELGRALANTGDETAALEAFDRAEIAARLRQDAWRNNMVMVLERMAETHVEHSDRGLTFSWQPDAAAVLKVYLPDFYVAAREEFAVRYGYTPPPARIEVFRRLEDFSVRSTGFTGFPALGVCFGPVVTAVSPLSQLRGGFSWAETAFHEYSHVVHLGLSHNRCPRWITEGLATWEEVNHNPAWTRNMRKDLLDARANDDLIPVRDLNRAFRTPRIIFAYYQGGLLCKMLIDEHGFAPMVRLLEAFDRGLDLDQALGSVFGLSPEELDAEFRAFVDAELEGVHEEPLWNPGRAARLRLRAGRTPPGDADLESWIEDWCTLAWSAFQHGRRVDAEEALRVLSAAGASVPRMHFLRGFIALQRDDAGAALPHFLRGLEQGGEGFRVRTAVAAIYQDREEWDEALEHLQAAEAAFPGYPQQVLSAEIRLAELYDLLGRVDDAMRARERWLAWNSGVYGMRLEVARWHVAAGRHAESLAYFREANEVDPFRRALHREWGLALLAAGRAEEALRELEVALIVPPELDADDPGPLGDGARAELLGRAALALVELGRAEEARERADAALELDDDCEPALEARERLE